MELFCKDLHLSAHQACKSLVKYFFFYYKIYFLTPYFFYFVILLICADLPNNLLLWSNLRNSHHFIHQFLQEGVEYLLLIVLDAVSNFKISIDLFDLEENFRVAKKLKTIIFSAIS